MRGARLPRRDWRDLAHRFSLLVGNIVGFGSRHAERRVHGVQQRILSEGFEKAIHGTVSENAGANRLVTMRRNEDNRESSAGS